MCTHGRMQCCWLRWIKTNPPNEHRSAEFTALAPSATAGQTTGSSVRLQGHTRTHMHTHYAECVCRVWIWLQDFTGQCALKCKKHACVSHIFDVALMCWRVCTHACTYSLRQMNTKGMIYLRMFVVDQASVDNIGVFSLFKVFLESNARSKIYSSLQCSETEHPARKLVLS